MADFLRLLRSAFPGSVRKPSARRDGASSRVFQFHDGAALGDAVTNSMFYVKDLLADYAIPCRIFTEHRDDRLADQIGLIWDFDPSPDDVLLIHHSMGHDIMPLLEALPCKKLLIYHNITPARFFERGSHTRRYVSIGLGALDKFRTFVDGAIGVSEFNAAELRQRGFDSPATIPVLRDYGTLQNRDFNVELQHFNAPRYQLLFVGRVSPHKGQSGLIEFMRQYADAFEHPVYLTLVGSFDPNDPYAKTLLRSIEDAGLESRIELAGHVSEADLYGHYRAADAFVCMSEHEGFGVPLLEAMAFDVPVLAYNSGALAETLGGAGILLDSTAPPDWANRLSRLFSDGDHRRQLLRSQRRRLAAFDRSRVGAALIEFLTPFLPQDVVPRLGEGGESPRAIASTKSSAATRHYIIEGPCETSYSLAIVNRTLALALNARDNRSVSLVPMEGIAGYKLNEDGVRLNPEIVPLLQARRENPEATVVSCRNMYPMRPAGMVGDYRLGGVAFEESEISQSMARMFNRYLDGMLAASSFVRTVLRNSGVRVPIAVHGHGIDHLPLVPRQSRQADDRFTFLHVSSGLARKGIEELFLAYAAAFSRNDDVQLVVKTYRNEMNVIQALYDRIGFGRGDAPTVRLIFDDLSPDDMAALYAMSDAIVLPTRGEGFCYPAAEGMRCGLPVVITGWSGHMDFCSNDNCYLVDYEFELARSHVSTEGAMWSRAQVEDLVKKLRHLFGSRGQADMERKLSNARASASALTAQGMAGRVDAFVDHLTTDPRQRRKLKIGWVTTWNTKCGIATHSELSLPHLPSDRFDVVVLANHWDGLRPDEDNVRRCWTHRGEPLDKLVQVALSEKCDVVLFQYNYSFHSLRHLAEAVDALEDAGVDTFVEIHKTLPIVVDGQEESIGHFTSVFAKATRLIVHTIEDVNRLKGFGLVDNVVKIPPGAMAPIQVPKQPIREFLGLGQFGPIIGSYGFLWPPKGIPQLIIAFALVLRHHPDAVLLLVNAVVDDLSRAERDKCLALIETCGLGDSVVMVNDYLEHEESMLLLQACDVIVFPYQRSGESASGAVRYGISSGCPVLTTPLAIFDEVAAQVERAEGFLAADLAPAIERLLGDAERRASLGEAQAEWLSQHSWQATTERIANMILGLYQDKRQIILERPLKANESPSRLPADMEWMDRIGDKAFVQIAYRRYTGDDADNKTLEDYLAKLSSGALSKQELISQLVSTRAEKIKVKDDISPHRFAGGVETLLFSDLNNGDDKEFVQTLYRVLLNRDGDPAGVAHYLAFLNGKGDRRRVVKRFLKSNEFKTNNPSRRVVFDRKNPAGAH
jgi:glycosyltransferase involved in cell wall biosynthesis